MAGVSRRRRRANRQACHLDRFEHHRSQRRLVDALQLRKFGHHDRRQIGGNRIRRRLRRLDHEWRDGRQRLHVPLRRRLPGAASQTAISQFNSNKDVIDLSYINSNPNNIPGASSNFTFIGTSSFTAAGDQVRYQYNAATNSTLVEANLAGDDNPNAPDFEINLVGQVNLTAANFALTSSQSSADLAAAAALVSTSNTSVAGAVENLYSNVQGRSYTSFQEIHSTAGNDAAIFDNTDGSGTINVYNPYLTVSAGSSGWSITDCSGTFAITPHATETAKESFGDDIYNLSKGFGNFTINNFQASGTTPDKLHLATSMFSYLNSSMSKAADLAAVISHATFSGGNSTINDSYGDSLTLVGVTQAMLTADSKHITFA